MRASAFTLDTRRILLYAGSTAGLAVPFSAYKTRPGARQKEGTLTYGFGHTTAAFAVRESDSRLKRCWRAYLDTGNTLHERQQVQKRS